MSHQSVVLLSDGHGYFLALECLSRALTDSEGAIKLSKGSNSRSAEVLKHQAVPERLQTLISVNNGTIN